MKEHWDHKESIQNNLEKMGVAFDANKVISSQKTTKEQYVEKIKETSSEKSSVEKEKKEEPTPKKSASSLVIKRLEAEAAEAHANKKQTFRFPKEQVRWITFCMDKHGDDFKGVQKNFLVSILKLTLANRYFFFFTSFSYGKRSQKYLARDT